MKDLLNCPNCGAVVDLTADKCAYCGTPYPPRKKDPANATAEPCALYIDGKALAARVQDQIFTPNEARRCLGLRGI